MSDKFATWEEAVLWLKAQPGQETLVRDCYYDDPLEEAAERYYTSTEWSGVRLLLEGRHDGRVLDLGAGRGISSYALARDGWAVTALEPDPSDIVGAGAIRRLTAEKQLRVMVVESWGEQLPFPTEHFDLVYTRQSLHHARDLDHFCREAHRVLRTGGIFIATREHVIDRTKDLQRFLDSHPLHGLYGGENAYPLKEYITAIEGSGITLKKVLATYDSDINLFPGTKVKLKDKIFNKLKIRIPDRVMESLVIPLLNRSNHLPGRLYSFVGYKR